MEKMWFRAKKHPFDLRILRFCCIFAEHFRTLKKNKKKNGIICKTIRSQRRR